MTDKETIDTKISETVSGTKTSSDPSTDPISLDIIDCSKEEYINKKVKIQGWINFGREGRKKKLYFCIVRDGTAYIQCVFDVKNMKDYDPAQLPNLTVRETSIELIGTLQKYPEGHKASSTCPRTIDCEIQVESWKLIGTSNVDIRGVINEESDIQVIFDQRHISLRRPSGFIMLTVRNAMLNAFRTYYQTHRFVEVSPPTFSDTFCESGSSLFKLDFFGTPAYMTQSSQLYLETVLPVVKRTYCILPSFRAEKSVTRRHLSEFTHLEAEIGFIKFEDLLNHLEDIICYVCEEVMKSVGDLILSVNPDFKVPKKPFKRMTYADAIKFCNEHEILNNETGKPFEYGDDITEKPERMMTDMIGEPIFMIRFPTRMKAFYMKKCEDNPEETESVDLLMPNVGEIVGGSMRIEGFQELLEAYKRVGLDPKPYYWFTEQRKYGSVPHGGYGIGTERLMMWLLKSDHIRDMCLYPRYVGRCKP